MQQSEISNPSFEQTSQKKTRARLLISNDIACVELAVRYIELRYIGSYSGFMRALLARALKSAALTAHQIERLNRVFLSIVENHYYTEEFKEYVKLWRRIASPESIRKLEALAAKHQSGIRGAWFRQFASNPALWDAPSARPIAPR